MITSGRCETSIRGSCVHSRYAENPRSVMLFFMNSKAQLIWFGSRIVILCGRHACPTFGRRWLSLCCFSLHRFGLHQPPTFPVVIKNFRVAPPVHGSVKLALHFLFGKMVIENVMKKFVVNCVVRLPFQNAVN